ncbi:MAG: MBL fold metallo-hydrolase [Nodosilinea sp. LVE1205-7]
MKRRKLMGYAGLGLATGLGLDLLATEQVVQAQSDRLTIRSLGHTAFLFTGGSRKILVNPFRRAGCTAGFPSPALAADIVMVSSRLLDEGYLNDLPGQPKVLSDPGVYDLGSLRIQGILTAHDRDGGRRFGSNVIWKWNQGGITLVHMGGAAAPLQVEEQILLGRPDILLIPVGGGDKAYTPTEAVQAIQLLRPKLVIPTHYLTAAAADSCTLKPLDQFLGLMKGTPVSRASGSSLSLRPADLPAQGMRIQVYQAPLA